MASREEFIDIFRTYIHREGSEELLDYLMNKSDFFTAPASARFHGSYVGGLCDHSVNVFRCLEDYLARPRVKDTYGLDYDMESVAIVALLHDLCKVGCYKAGTRNVKNETTGQWEKVKIYTSEDPFPYGHGEKSVFLVERFVRLTTEEAMAIRWHMGGFDDSARAGNYSIGEAFKRYPLAVMAHLADLEATYLLEKGTSTVNK